MNVIRLQDFEPPARKPTSVIAGFDALRAFAALAVVALHAGVPYLRHPMPGLLWPAWDSSSSVVDAVFWSIEVVIMPLFLVLAGFLMWNSSQRLSPGRLVRSRAKRLLIPLAFGVLVVLPIDLYIWTLGLVAEGVVPAIKLKSLKFEEPISSKIWGLSHLWFLLYVFLYVAVAAILLRLLSRPSLSRLTRVVSRPTILFAVLAGIAIATLAASPEVVWGFQHAFLPVPSKWIYSGVFFAAGCGLALHDGELKQTSLSAPRLLAIGLVLLATSVTLGTWSLEQTDANRVANRAASFLLALLTVAAATTTTFGLIGASVRYVKEASKPIRYVAAASFWIYLIHHPLLGLIHTDIKWIWPQGQPVMKLCVSFVIATGVSLLMFEALVRRSRFGSSMGLVQPAPPLQKQREPEAERTEAIRMTGSEERRAA